MGVARKNKRASLARGKNAAALQSSKRRRMPHTATHRKNLGQSKPQSLNGKKLPHLLSLFSGAGGLDYGFHQAGFKTALAIDFDESAIASFNKNFGKGIGSVGDLTELGPAGVLNLLAQKLPKGSPLGVIGGPPCQGFSRANTQSTADDPRNKLPAAYLRIVQKLCETYDVRFILFENVTGIKATKHSNVYKKIVAKIKALGFSFHEAELDASEHGVPQIRKRVILIGIKHSKIASFRFPKPQKNKKTVRETIAGLPTPSFFTRDLKTSEIKHHKNHWTMMPKSKRFKEAVNVDRSAWRSFKKLAWDAPSRTIAFGHREILVHPNGKRRLSILEAMLLQGFPKKYRLIGNLSSQVTQVSNAVPPPLARVVANQIKATLLARRANERR